MPMPSLNFVSALLGILAIAACGESTGSTGWRGTVDTLASGTVVVRNGDAPLLAGASGWRLEEEVRIGTRMGDGPAAFGRIGWLLADPEGDVYVLDTQAQEIRVFDARGEYLRTIGRPGEGPGELKDAAAMGWSPSGDLRVVDPGTGRLTVFHPSGELVETHPLPGGFQVYPWPGVFEPDGGLVVPVPHQRDGEFEIGLLRYGPGLAAGDTLSAPRFDGEERFFELADDEGGGIRVTVPYSGGVQWDLTPAGTFWAATNTARYEVEELSAAGDTLLRIQRAFEPAPLTSAEKDSAAAGLEWFTDQGGRVDRSRFPERRPAIVRLWVAPTGHLFVQPTTSAFGSGWSAPASTLDVFEPDGRWLTRLPLPEGFTTSWPEPLFTDSVVYAGVRDELDVPYVVRFRLVRPEASP